MNPPDLKYTREHEWVRLEDGGICVIGITDHAQDALGDVVFVNVPAENTVLKQFDRFGEVESVKAVSDLYAPLSGRVVEANPLLEDSPELINEEPFGRGWLIRVESGNLTELENLLSANEYEQYLVEVAGH